MTYWSILFPSLCGLCVKPDEHFSGDEWCFNVLHSSRKNPYPPQGRSLEIPRGRGS